MTLARRALAWVVLVLVLAMVWPADGAAAATQDRAAQAWYRQVLSDLHPLQSSLIGALDAASGWAGGTESATTARGEFARDLPQLERVHRTLQRLAPLRGRASARSDYISAIGLYVDALGVDEAATEIPAGALQMQLQHSYQRVRGLGDIVFDQGTAELAPELGPGLAGPDVNAASHVPEWTGSGLAPGPPLVSSWCCPDATTSRRQGEAAWAAQVAKDGAPTQTQVQRALGGTTRSSSLARLALALGTAEAFDSSVPVPTADPLDSNRRRLGLLVDAEALMSADAARLNQGDPARMLDAVARNLGGIGGRLRAES